MSRAGGGLLFWNGGVAWTECNECEGKKITSALRVRARAWRVVVTLGHWHEGALVGQAGEWITWTLQVPMDVSVGPRLGDDLKVSKHPSQRLQGFI